MISPIWYVGIFLKFDDIDCCDDVPATDSSNAVFLIYDKYVIQKKKQQKEKKKVFISRVVYLVYLLVYLDQVLEGIRKGARRAWVVYWTRQT